MEAAALQLEPQPAQTLEMVAGVMPEPVQQPMLHPSAREQIINTTKERMRGEIAQALDQEIRNQVVGTTPPVGIRARANLVKYVDNEIIQMEGTATAVPETVTHAIRNPTDLTVNVINDLRDQFIGQPDTAQTRAGIEAVAAQINHRLLTQQAVYSTVQETLLNATVSITTQQTNGDAGTVEQTPPVTYQIRQPFAYDLGANDTTAYTSWFANNTVSGTIGSYGIADTALTYTNTANPYVYGTGVYGTAVAGGVVTTVPGNYNINVTYNGTGSTYAAMDGVQFSIDGNGQWFADTAGYKKASFKAKMRSQLAGENRKRQALTAQVSAPELKARDTLRDMLPEWEWRRYVTNGFILVKAASGRTYQVFADHHRERMRVYEDKKHIATLCIHTSDVCPPSDHVIAMKIQIELDEESVWKDSNVSTHNGNTTTTTLNQYNGFILNDLLVANAAVTTNMLAV